MGRKKPVSLGHLEFESQKDAKEHFREILNRYSPGQVLVEADRADVEALLCNHPRADEKIGPGIGRIFVDADDHSGQCFHVARTDETTENFSYLKCITGDPNPRTMFSMACRRAVEDELYLFKKDYFDKNDVGGWKVRCPETGEVVGFSESHVDHRPPMTFSMIVHFFIETNHIDPATVDYTRDGEYGARFADEAVAEQFRQWHKKHAILRVIKGTRNAAKAFLGRVALTQADRKLT